MCSGTCRLLLSLFGCSLFFGPLCNLIYPRPISAAVGRPGGGGIGWQARPNFPNGLGIPRGLKAVYDWAQYPLPRSGSGPRGRHDAAAVPRRGLEGAARGADGGALGGPGGPRRPRPAPRPPHSLRCTPPIPPTAAMAPRRRGLVLLKAVLSVHSWIE